MFAMLASFIFAGAAYVAAFAVVSTVRDSGSRIADALQGRPLARISPRLRVAA
jgi:hypothetical protein